MDPKEQATIRALPGNSVCADCHSKAEQPQWASAPFGILLCIQCSGIHRSLGTHISFVRSVTMDDWTDQQIGIMKAGGGNHACNDFLQKHGVTTNDIRAKYSSPAAQLYKQVLVARYQGTPEPTELPPPIIQTTDATHRKKKYAGFGSEPRGGPQKRDRKLLSKRTITRSLVVLGISMATAALFFLPSTSEAATRVLSIRQVQSFYNTVGSALDLMAVVEDEPRNLAIQMANLHRCKSILEIGCGTGRTASRILHDDEYPFMESYTCMDVSSTMVDLTRRRLQLEKSKEDSNHRHGAQVTVLEENALDRTKAWPAADCILAFYVLDILSTDDIQVFLHRAHESLLLEQDEGSKSNSSLDDDKDKKVIALVSITMPPPGLSNDGQEGLGAYSWSSRIVMVVWQWIATRFPILLGGCRPIQLKAYLENDADNWKIQECATTSVLGYTSEIVIATPNN